MAGKTKYRRQRRLLPGVRLNFNKPWRVNSMTLGKPGFVSWTLGGGQGAFNVDLPGGFSWRKRFAKDEDKQPDTPDREVVEPNAVTWLVTFCLGVGVGGWLL